MLHIKLDKINLYKSSEYFLSYSCMHFLKTGPIVIFISVEQLSYYLIYQANRLDGFLRQFHIFSRIRVI